MNYKKTIERLEDTLSCFFDTNVKFKVYESKENELLLPGSEVKELYFKNKPTGILRCKEEFEYYALDENAYTTDVKSLLTNLKEYK